MLDPAVIGKVIDQVSHHQTKPSILFTIKVTRRELEILQLIAKSLSNADIADRQSLSETTVRNHVSTILALLGVSDRTHAAIIAIQHGLDIQLIFNVPLYIQDAL